MKRFLSLTLSLVFLIGLCPTPVFASYQITTASYDESSMAYQSEESSTVVYLTLNDVPLEGDMPAINVGGRTLVPVRLVAEALNIQVSWSDSTRQVLLQGDDDFIILTLGSENALVNGNQEALPDGIPATLVSYQGVGYTMVPLRFVSEALGTEVLWDSDTGTAMIYTQDETTEDETPGEELLPLEQDLITSIDYNGTSVVIATSIPYPEYNVTDLGDRIAIDFLNAVLVESGDTLALEDAVISQVRYAQYNGSEYEYANTVRVVLDLYEGYYLSPHIELRSTSEGLVIASNDVALDEPWTTPITPEEFTIVLDPGHGGTQPGAFYNDIAEKDINLTVSFLVEEMLLDLGYNVIMTRYDDSLVGLYDRADIANEAEANIFVSIHANAAPTNLEFQGTFTYYHPGSARGARLAQSIQTAFCMVTGSVDRGILSEDFVVLRETDMCAVLVELGFMTCYEELLLMLDESYQHKMAVGIVEGIIQYLNTPTPISELEELEELEEAAAEISDDISQ